MSFSRLSCTVFVQAVHRSVQVHSAKEAIVAMNSKTEEAA